jgi:hypothetical protein
MTELTIMWGDGAGDMLSFGPTDILRVTGHGMGQAVGEAFIQVNFPVDLVADVPGTNTFKISALIPDEIPGRLDNMGMATLPTTNIRTGGSEVLFLTDETMVVIPEPSAFLFGGLVCVVVGLGAAWRRWFGKAAAPAAAA